MMPVSLFLIPRGSTRTARRSLAKRLRACGKKSILRRRRRLPMRMNSGSSLAFPCTICARITLTSISSTIHPSVRSRATEPDFTRRCWKRRHREKSATSVSRTTGLPWQMRRSSQDFMRRFSSRSAIWRQRRTSSWWRSVSRREWDLLQ